jgi:hypothetical protein
MASVARMFTFFTPPASIIPVPPASEAPATEALTSLPHRSVTPVLPASEAPATEALTSLPHPSVTPQPSVFRTSAVTPYAPPSSLPSIATHAERNPHMAVQQARVHPNQSHAQKATADLRRLQDHEKKDLLATELGEFMERQRNEMEDLADRHATTVEHLNKLLNHTPHYLRKVRAINIENAKIHAKGEEVNAGKL